MDVDTYRNQKGVIKSENLVILTKSYDFIAELYLIDTLLNKIKSMDIKEIRDLKGAELFKQFGGLCMHMSKLDEYKKEYPYATLAPTVNLFFEVLDSFIHNPPNRKILGIRRLNSNQQKIDVSFAGYYSFDKYVLADLHAYPKIKLEFQYAFKPLVICLHNKLNSQDFKKKRRAKQQGLSKSKCALNGFVDDLIKKNGSADVVSIVVYPTSTCEMLNGLFYIDDNHVKQYAAEKEKAKQEMFSKLKSLGESREGFQVKENIIVFKAMLARQVLEKQREQDYIAHVCDLRAKLIEKVKNSYKGWSVDYISKLEHSKTTGVYVRFFFFFKPCIGIINKENLAKEVGQLWIKDVTKGVGFFQNNNLVSPEGLGTISHSDTAAIKALKEKVLLLSELNSVIDNTFTRRKTLVKTTP